MIHMNKFKHVTPTNIAPLGKRLNYLKKEENNENTKQSIDQMIQQTPSSIAHNIVHTQTHHQSSASSLAHLTIPQTHQQLSWSCELCGRMFSTREEWSVHAKSHLEVCILSCFDLTLFCACCIQYDLCVIRYIFFNI